MTLRLFFQCLTSKLAIWVFPFHNCGYYLVKAMGTCPKLHAGAWNYFERTEEEHQCQATQNGPSCSFDIQLVFLSLTRLKQQGHQRSFVLLSLDDISEWARCVGKVHKAGKLLKNLGPGVH